MEELKYKNNVLTKFYTYNKLTEKINDDNDFATFFEECERNNNYEELEEYLDKYFEYICDIIDDADSFVFYTPEQYKQVFLDNLKYSDCYKMIYTENGEVPYNLEKFDISNDESKKLLKENIKFNVGDYEDEIWIIPTQKSYILNDSDIEYKTIGSIFISKNDELLIELSQIDGYIRDYRPKEVIESHQEKYKKLVKSR